MHRIGPVTANEAGRRLGRSSGLCSFHLRQLGRVGLIEEAPRSSGRARPWRLAAGGGDWAAADAAGWAGREDAADPTDPTDAGDPGDAVGEGLSALNRGLENESYQRWLAERERAPEPWRRDDAFSAVLYLGPEEIDLLAEELRRLLAPYRIRESSPSARPPDAGPVAVVSRIFPILPPGRPSDPPGDRPSDPPTADG
ncbi:winged helix-turn-helix transcriptional regulator [Streptacidiphilus sp. P02-A3a]|nr:winged helix-turn-helix transcriptional regulator [Streptacidiphilus sp. P02-A3a]